MRAMVSAGVAFAFLCVSAVVRLSAADAAAGEMAKLQGTWLITSMVRAGESRTPSSATRRS